MKTSLITWHSTCEPPDADLLVLVHCPDESEPVQCGYFDSADAVWRNDKGDVLDEPELWAELPVVPTN